jgi:hypothetical protein
MENTSYLIQRLEKPWVSPDGEIQRNPFTFGCNPSGGMSPEGWETIEGIFAFDYMGAAEFEFGAVPAALYFLIEQRNADNLECGSIELPQGNVHYISPKPYTSEVLTRLRDFATDNPNQYTKEYVGLNHKLKEMAIKALAEKQVKKKPRKNARPVKPPYESRAVGWLEIDNGYMFFTDKEMFTKVCNLFELKPLPELLTQ